MGKIIGDGPCPECRKKGRDKTGNHLICFDSGVKYCNRCGYKVLPNKEIGGGSVDKKLSVSDFKPAASLDRKISKETYAHYNVVTEFNEKNGEAVARYYPVTEGGIIIDHKKRLLPKTFSFVKGVKGKKIELFGQAVTPKNGRILLITGGEEDACAAFEILNKTTDKITPAVVSLIKGENVAGITDNIDYIKSFEKVILSMDNDDPGRVATDKIISILGPDVFILTHSEKDISDLHVKGKDREFIQQFWGCKKYKPSTVLSVEDVYDRAVVMPTHGIPWPWPSLTKATYGIRPGEGIYFGAGVKIGKSEALNELVTHLISLGEKPFLIKAEEVPQLTVKKIAGKIHNKMFHKPDGNFTKTELEAAVKGLFGKFSMFDFHYKGGNQTELWDSVLSAIRCQVADGCRHIFIDPVTCLTDGMPAAEADSFLKVVARELDDASKKLGFTYYVFCHLNAPKTGAPHEEGGEVKSFQFANSRVMMRACTYMIGLQRNKKAEDEIERNTTTFVLLEDRMFGNFVKFPVFYDRETGDYKEVEDQF